MTAVFNFVISSLPCWKPPGQEILQSCPLQEISEKIVHGVRSFFESITKISHAIPQSLIHDFQRIDFSSLMFLPETVGFLAKNIYKIVAPESSEKSRVINFFKLCVNAQSVASAAATICYIAKMVGIVTEKAVAWVPILGYTTIFTNSISLVLRIRKIIHVAAVITTVGFGLYKASSTQEDLQKTRIYRAILVKIERMNPVKISRRIDIHSQANLTERVRTLISRLDRSEKDALKDSANFLDILFKRSVLRCTLHSASGTGNILNIISAIFSAVIPVPIVAIPISCISSMLSSTSNNIERYLIRPNPFDPQSKCRLEEIWLSIKDVIYKIIDIYHHVCYT